VAKRLFTYRFAGIVPVTVILTILGTLLLSGVIGASPVIDAPVAVATLNTPIPTQAAASPVTQSVTQPTVAVETEDADPSQTLAEALPALLTENAGVTGVIVVAPDGTVAYEANADLPFISASLYKLPLMAQIYALIERGELTLDQKIPLNRSFFQDATGDYYYAWNAIGTTTTVREALLATGAYSSNAGALALLSLTTWDDVNQMAASLSMSDTHLRASGSELAAWLSSPDAVSQVSARTTAIGFITEEAATGPVMLTTPRDVALFFRKLMAGTIVSQSASAGMIEILSQQAVDDRFPAQLPDDVQLVHKTGNLDGVVHDAGSMITQSGPVILAVLTEANADDAIATEMLQEIARATYDAFTPS
jgi:beta-lactamase class A